MKEISGVVAGGAGTARAFWGPYPKGTFLSSLVVANAAATSPAMSLSIALFVEKPADTAAAFATGESLCQPVSTVSGAPAVPLLVASFSPVIPLNVRVDQFRWLGVQASVPGAASYFFAVDSDAGKYARKLRSEQPVRKSGSQKMTSKPAQVVTQGAGREVTQPIFIKKPAGVRR